MLSIPSIDGDHNIHNQVNDSTEVRSLNNQLPLKEDSRFITQDGDTFVNYRVVDTLDILVYKNGVRFTDELGNEPLWVTLLNPDSTNFTDGDSYALHVMRSKAIIEMDFQATSGEAKRVHVNVDGKYDRITSGELIECYRYNKGNRSIQGLINGKWVLLVDNRTLGEKIRDRIYATVALTQN